jgi:N-acetylglucosamine kinase-like BadF-type ATPase
MGVFVGLDCGGSSTRALIVDAGGAVLHRGRSGPGNWASTPREALRSHILECVQGAPAPEAVAACFAGLLTDDDRRAARALLEEAFPGARTSAHADTEAVLAADPTAHGGVIAGTGCTIFSRRQGRIWRTGGGGPLLGDRGSVFDVVRQALDRIAIRPDRMSASSAFWDKAEELTGERDPDRLIAAIYRAPAPARLAAKLGPAVIADAMAGAAYAVQALQAALFPLAAGLREHFRIGHPGLRQPDVVLAGGLWRIEPKAADELQDILSRMAQTEGPPYISVRILEGEPVEGAVRLAQAALEEAETR